ncbi:MAG: hypothetical protein FJ267_17375 [Planctomycetes bacterium]|nr:hypothetical protein [Planctomycetota bacterium]
MEGAKSESNFAGLFSPLFDPLDFDYPILFVVPPLGGSSACPVVRIHHLFRLKPGLQADSGQSNYQEEGEYGLMSGEDTQPTLESSVSRFTTSIGTGHLTFQTVTSGSAETSIADNRSQE